MHNILNFPERFRVKKHLGKERFMRHGNLTPSERRRLEAYMGNVELLYVIPYDDGSEMIVVSTEVELPATSQTYFTSNYAKAIAQSFPYLSLVIMRCQNLVKFFIFDERPNLKDPNRTYAENIYATHEMLFSVNDRELNSLASTLRSCIPCAKSATDLHNLWLNVIAGDPKEARGNAMLNSKSLHYFLHQFSEEKEAVDTYESILDDDYADDYEEEFDPDDYEWDQLEYEDEIRCEWGEKAYEEEREDRLMYHNALDYSDMYEKRALHSDESIEEELFIEFCTSHCWPLFVEATETYYTAVQEREWFEDYFEACNRYAEDFFGRSIDSNIAQKIRQAYNRHTVPNDDYYGSFDLQQLKSYLWRYFD